jgi:hypothetical protein
LANKLVPDRKRQHDNPELGSAGDGLAHSSAVGTQPFGGTTCPRISPAE